MTMLPHARKLWRDESGASALEFAMTFPAFVMLIMGTILSLFDIPIMHTYVDDFIRWLNRTFLNREWSWPVDPEASVPSSEEKT